MRSTLTCEQLKVAGPYYRQHPELVGQIFAGPHDTVPKDEVLVVVQNLPDWPTSQYGSDRLLEGASWVLDWLLTFPGEGWRDWWIASGAPTPTHWAGWPSGTAMTAVTRRRAHDRDRGMRTLIVSRVILPGYEFFSRWKTKGYQQIIDQQDLAVGAEMHAIADQIEMGGRKRRDVWSILGKIMLHTGKDLPAARAEDIFELRAHYREKIGIPAQALGPTWALLAGAGIFRKDSSLRTALRVGQCPPAELIDRYGVAPGPVRNLLVRYLEERKSSVDYTTIKSLARMLAGNFWADLERHHPDLAGTDSLAAQGDGDRVE